MSLFRSKGVKIITLVRPMLVLFQLLNDYGSCKTRN